MENKAAAFPSRDLFLNTQGICFLCVNSLARQDEVSLTTSNNGDGREVHLRLLCRYLNVSPLTVLQRAIGLSEEEAKEDDSKNQCDFSVSLCGQCASLVEELTALVKQQEMVAMLLEHHVRVLKQVLLNSKEIRMRDVSNDLGSAMEPVEVELVEQLRIETRRKCIQKENTLNKDSFPKVVIPRVKRSVSPMVPVLTEFECHPERLNSPPLNNVTSFFNDTPPELSGPYSPVKSVSNNISDQVSTTPSTVGFYRKLNDDLCECSFCNATQSGNNIRRHLVNVHPEIFFSSSKLPSLTDETFKMCCKHLLTTKASMLESRDGAVCSICSKTYLKVQNLNVHLVSQHRAELLNCLFLIQETEEKVQSVLPVEQKEMDASGSTACIPSSTERDNKRFRCDFDNGGCGVMYRHRQDLSRHKLRANQTGKVLFSCKHRENGVHCALEFTSKCALTRHQKQTDHKNLTRVQSPNRADRHAETWRLCSGALIKKRLEQAHGKMLSNKILERTSTEASPIITKTKEPPRVYCDFENGGCGQAYRNSQLLLAHKRRAKRLTSRKWLCSFIGDEYMCFQEFDSFCALSRHKREFQHAIVNQRSPLICKASAGGCGRTFSEMCRLIRHVKRSCLTTTNSLAALEHNDIKPRIPPTQRNSVASSGTVSNGNRQQPRRWVCMLRKGGCERTFASKYGLARHKRLHCMKRRGAPKLTPRQPIIKREYPLDKVKLRRACHLCPGKRLFPRDLFQKHLLLAHGKTIKQEKVKVEETSPVPSPSNEILKTPSQVILIAPMYQETVNSISNETTESYD